jgi:hypothetical protein
MMVRPGTSTRKSGFITFKFTTKSSSMSTEQWPAPSNSKIHRKVTQPRSRNRSKQSNPAGFGAILDRSRGIARNPRPVSWKCIQSGRNGFASSQDWLGNFNKKKSRFELTAETTTF